jgi:DtxR family transcriptional regulator, Mn-dependent transcriptional regulator
MPSEFHPPVEEYLQTIEYLEEEGTPVIGARLAYRLGKSAPAVSEMLDRLTADGYLNRSKRQITLTDKGRAVAESVIRKHRLAERFLVDVIGLPWHKVHDEAGRWEHVISDEVESKLVGLLGDPSTCPHGNPIPGSASPLVDRTSLIALGEAQAGQSVRLERLSEELELDNETLQYMNSSGFTPGRTVLLKVKAPDGSLVLDIEGGVLALGADVCRKLFVSVVT